MKKLLIGLALITMASTANARDISELSTPIMVLTPAVAKNQDALNLNPDQRAIVKDWLNTMPKKREAVEDKAVEVRAALRNAIINGEPEEKLNTLAEEVGSLESQLVLMRANCVNHWRDVLDAEQFQQALRIANYK